MSAEFNNVGTTGAFGHTAKYHQYDDIAEFMTDVSLVRSAEIED